MLRAYGAAAVCKAHAKKDARRDGLAIFMQLCTRMMASYAACWSVSTLSSPPSMTALLNGLLPTMTQYLPLRLLH